MSENPFGEGFDLNALLQQAQAMQEQLMAAQAELAEATVEGTAGGGLVTVTVSGTGELLGVQVSDRLLRPRRRRQPRPTSVTWWWRPSATPRRRADALAQEQLGPMAGGLGGRVGGGLGGPPGRRARASPAASVYEGVLQDLIDELGRLPGRRSEERPADRLPPARRRPGRRTPARRRAARGQGEGPVLRDLRQRRRGGAVPDLPRPAARRRADLRRRGAQGRRRDRADPRVPRPLPRARRRDHARSRASVPTQLRVRELIARLNDGTVTEIILATDPNIEGDATATYLTRMLVPMGLRVTRLASGLPVGGDLEYADEVTLGRAFAGRRSADV